MNSPKQRIWASDGVAFNWNSSVRNEIVGISTVYDFYTWDRYSLFGKLGLAYNKLSASIQNDVVEAFLDSRRSTKVHGAFGVRIPLSENSKGSGTGAYQVVGTPSGIETSFAVGGQWRW